MKFHPNAGSPLKGIDKNLTHFPQEILNKIPQNQIGLNVHLNYQPTFTCYIDLNHDIETFAKARALEMYLKHHHIKTNFLYKPLPRHKFLFHIEDNIVRVFTEYFMAEYRIDEVLIEDGHLKAIVTKVIS